MKPVRELLPDNLWRTMDRKLGREECLRQLWPVVVGEKLAGQIQLRQLRGKTLLVAIPDREWHAPMVSMQSAILYAVNRFAGLNTVNSIELIVEPRPFQPRAVISRNVGRATATKSEVLINADDIADEKLRETFLRSAQKYFSRSDMASGKESAS